MVGDFGPIAATNTYQNSGEAMRRPIRYPFEYEVLKSMIRLLGAEREPKSARRSQRTSCNTLGLYAAQHRADSYIGRSLRRVGVSPSLRSAIRRPPRNHARQGGGMPLLNAKRMRVMTARAPRPTTNDETTSRESSQEHQNVGFSQS